MSLFPSAAAEIYSVREIARAAGVSPDAVRQLIRARTGARELDYLPACDAVRFVRQLRRGLVQGGRRGLFAPAPSGARSPAAGVAGSGALHAAIVGIVLAFAAFGLTTSAEKPAQRTNFTRIVFLATPGPGGGGGGGGLKQPAPPPKAELKSAALVKSPVPPPKPLTTRKPEPKVVRPNPVVTPAPAPVEPPPPPVRPAITPQVAAPVVTASSDPRDRAGLPAESPAEKDSQGTGSGGGVGTGQGSGLGEGTGAGIGPGSGGGTGGGPYRPGSGITAPGLLREVKPTYTEEARRMGVEGDVVLEIVVRHNGTVGEVKVLHGLPGGLDRRAIDAVRQWQFSPARRFGTPVDVMVEVAVEFKLR